MVLPGRRSFAPPGPGTPSQGPGMPGDALQVNTWRNALGLRQVRQVRQVKRFPPGPPSKSEPEVRPLGAHSGFAVTVSHVKERTREKGTRMTAKERIIRAPGVSNTRVGSNGVPPAQGALRAPAGVPDFVQSRDCPGLNEAHGPLPWELLPENAWNEWPLDEPARYLENLLEHAPVCSKCGSRKIWKRSDPDPVGRNWTAYWACPMWGRTHR
jgi:hypothetical protein